MPDPRPGDVAVQQCDLVIEGALVVEPTAGPPRRASIGIKDGQIEGRWDVVPADATGPDTEIIQADGLYALPGLVNTHSHLFQTLMRGLGDELSGDAWFREMMLPAAGAFTPDDARVAASVGCAEALLGGVTTVFDFMQVHGQPGMADAVVGGMRATGVRAVYGRGIVATGEASGMPAHLIEPAEQAIADCEALQQTWASDGDMVSIWAAPYAVWALTEPAARTVATWAERTGARLTMHASASAAQVQGARERFGMTDLAWLGAMGLLTDRSQVVHMVHLDDEGIGLLARSGAAVAHCPVANLYGGDGVAPVPAMRRAGVRVGLGTDGAASNNTQSLFETMKLAVLAQRGVGRSGVGAQEALAMATSEAAAAIGMGDRIGRLAPGYRADILLLDPRRLPIAPSHNPISDVVYAGSSSCVHTVLVDGKVVVHDGKLLTLNTAALLEEAQARADSLVRRAGLEHHRTRSRSGVA